MCPECRRSIGHDCRCPNYIQPKAERYCEYCGEGIYENDKYIENCDSEFRHLECFMSTREIVEWLGFEIKVMNRNNRYD